MNALPRCLRLASALALSLAAAPAPLPAQGFQVPVQYEKLENGLRVVLSRDTTAPVVTVAVYFNVGFRIEPRNRTGFAHLFEHLMFQGSQNLGKMEFVRLIQSSGGTFNGSTRFDFTNYFETLPSHKLETALWAEADRMRGLAITQENLANQQGVVKNEVKVNVLNQPYGGFPWLDVPQVANTNWYNAHNFYGDLTDLDSANLDDVREFFRTFYAPNNAVLVVVGDFEPAAAMQMVHRFFDNIPGASLPPAPDLTEPRQDQEKSRTKMDSLANRPALAFAYHMPERRTPEYWAMGLIDQILVKGEDSRLHQALVQRRGLTDQVIGGVNVGLGNLYNYKGPMLWTGFLFHDADKPAATIVSALDSVIADLQNRPVDRATLDRALVKARSSFYDMAGSLFGRADLLASFALFDDDPGQINRIETAFRQVTPQLIQRTAREYLRPTNRTLLMIDAKAHTVGEAGQ
jgi:predicted Zn-dependent peptidase